MVGDLRVFRVRGNTYDTEEIDPRTTPRKVRSENHAAGVRINLGPSA